MIVRHDVMVHGPEHVVEMTLRVRLRYDREGKVESIDLEPEDLGLFDHVVNTTLRKLPGLVGRVPVVFLDRFGLRCGTMDSQRQIGDLETKASSRDLGVRGGSLPTHSELRDHMPEVRRSDPAR